MIGTYLVSISKEMEADLVDDRGRATGVAGVLMAAGDLGVSGRCDSGFVDAVRAGRLDAIAKPMPPKITHGSDSSGAKNQL
ncbi:MAG: hypothetical protein AAF722_05130 [Cyanobacteria bacterium P01_C01_bin.70]